MDCEPDRPGEVVYRLIWPEMKCGVCGANLVQDEDGWEVCLWCDVV